MCCVLTALLITFFTAWRARLKTMIECWPQVRIATTLVTATIVFVAVSAVAAEHASHYLSRAHANERTVLAEFMAQPICRGSN
jgi:hypothetical protein